jgi:hypothetical protein
MNNNCHLSSVNVISLTYLEIELITINNLNKDRLQEKNIFVLRKVFFYYFSDFIELETNIDKEIGFPIEIEIKLNSITVLYVKLRN